MKLCIFGAGKRGIEIKNSLLKQNISIQGFIDNYFNGIRENTKVYSLQEAVGSFGKELFIIVSMKDMSVCNEICKQLEAEGLKKGKHYIVWEEITAETNERNNYILEHPLGMRKIYDMYRELEQVYKKYVLKDMELTEDGNAFNLLFNLIGTGNAEAIYIRYYLHKCLAVEGDVCEFGIAQGATSALLANDIKDTDKNLWLFDSFEGLSVPTEKDILKDDIFNLGSMDKYAYSMKCSIHEVETRLNEIDIEKTRIKIVPGFIEQTINDERVQNTLKKVSFAYIDFDLYEPILTALNYLKYRTVRGSVIVVDDYDFFSTGAKTAVQEFILENEGDYNLVLPADCSGHFCIIEKIR